MARLDQIDIPLLEFAEGAAPAAGAAAITRIYAKADGLMYSKDDAGTETLMSGGAGGGAVATDAIWDAKGDLAGGTGANTAAKLTVGTNGEILKAASGAATGLIWAIAPKFRGARAISNSTTTMTTANTEYAIALAGVDEYDTDAMHDPTTNNTRITVPAALTGLYFRARGQCYVPVTAGNNHLGLMIRKNANGVSGAGTRLGYVQLGVGAGNTVVEVNCDPFVLVTGDYIELFAVSNVASRTADASLSSLSLWVVGGPS